MRSIHGDLFTCPSEGDAICVTTNGIVKQDGCAVMGAGIAKAFAIRFPDLPLLLGEKLTQQGNHAYLLKYVNSYAILSFPTKNDWRNDSDLQLILQSCCELIAIADEAHLHNIYLPVPGCNNGHLNPDEVIPAIKEVLDDRFVLVLH